MSGKYILVVDDEEDILELISYHLEKEGFKAVCVDNGRKALEIVKKNPPDLIILDIMLPDISGFDIAYRIKKDREIPIIMLTAKGEENDIIKGLESGADDYIAKPFSLNILTARINAVMRRNKNSEVSDANIINLSDISVDIGKHAVFLKGEPLELTYTEFGILLFLLKKPGWVFTRFQIVDAVHGEDYPVTERSVDVQIASLRKKLGDAGAYIKTIRGIGYKFSV